MAGRPPSAGWLGAARWRVPAVACWLLVAAVRWGADVPLKAGQGADGAVTPRPRPNILWITSEDHGPHLGCYGDPLATTPHVDALAARGLRYTRAWSNAPVCAPARTTLISGMFATSTGSEHMRSMVPAPAEALFFPQLLRQAGYFCTNNAKEDYNLLPHGQVWDQSSASAHWRNRAEGQPFFAVFNCTKSHESQIRVRPHQAVHDPARVRVPPYHPDTPEVRRDWAQYYDVVTRADADAGERLRELAEAGLADSTIVFYFADHGSGMPRHKRSPTNSGLQVPLIVLVPEALSALRPADYTAGGVSDRLVSFVDFGPTVLSLAGVRLSAWMQGKAFLGPFASEPNAFLHGYRGRMDERTDLVRSVTDGRYVYVRNFMPHRPAGQHLSYMFQTPTTQVWYDRFVRGELNPVQAAYWLPKPSEELYDLNQDPDEVLNLAPSSEHRAVLGRLRQAVEEQILRVRDVGLLPEGEMHRRAKGKSPYDMAREEGVYPLERILAAALVASSREPCEARELRNWLTDPDPAVRYWGAMGALVQGPARAAELREELTAALHDETSCVAIAAAEVMARCGTPAEQAEALAVLGQRPRMSSDVFTSIAALQVLSSLGAEGEPVLEALRRDPPEVDPPHGRYRDYVPRLLAR